SDNDICGAASAGTETVQVSILQASSEICWDGSAFAIFCPNWITATDTTFWYYFFIPPADGAYTLSSRAIDGLGVAGPESSVSFQSDNTRPATTIDFPISGTDYSSISFASGCGTATVNDLCGSASDATAGISAVRVSIESDGSGACWNG